VQSAIAKGALRPRSRFGAAVQVLSSGQAQLILSDRKDLHTLTAFDLTHLPASLTREVPRYATATVLAEVMLRFAPPEPHPEGYAVLAAGIGRLESVPVELLAAESLRVIWQLVGALGFAPALEHCARDGRPLPEGDLPFSASDGGGLCPGCAFGTELPRLPAEARAALEALLDGDAELPRLDARNAAAHRRLVARYIRYHLAEGAALPGLEFWLAQTP
jgi:DNA repair protein RecO (recombination protein O)